MRGVDNLSRQSLRWSQDGVASAPTLRETDTGRDVEKVEALNERHFSQAVEPELKARGELVHVAVSAGIGESVDIAATYLTDACYYYGHESPF